MRLEDYNEYYIQGSDHYLIPKAVFTELYEEMANFREENQECKEVINKISNIINYEYNFYDDISNMKNNIEKILKEVEM